MSDPRFSFPKKQSKRLYRGTIAQAYVALRRGPKHSSPIETELLYGQGVDIHGEDGSWLYGRVVSLVTGAKRKGYIGYLPRKAVVEGTIKSAHMVSALSAPIFQKPDIKSRVFTALPMNAIVRVEKGPKEATGDLRPIDGLGFIHKAHVRCKRDELPQDFVEIAARFLGRPYIWGGTGGIGVDCSGLVQMSLAACGIDAPRDADQQEVQLGEPVELSEIKRGDLVFWAGHVGIMESKTQLLHANAHHMMTAREPLKKAIQRIGPPRIIKRL